jgi:hypothetical protein
MRNRLALAVAGAATVSLVATACGASSSVAGSRPPVDRGDTAVQTALPVAASGHRTAAENRAATRHEVRRLLKLAPLPPGVVRIKPSKHLLTEPGMGTPNGGSVVDRATFWKVDLPLATAFRDVKAHRPKGLTLNGTGQGGDRHGVTDEEIEWTEPDRVYAAYLESDVGLFKAGPDKTYVRADGEGDWIDPRPLRDDAKGKRLRVTVAAGCPKSDKGVVGVQSPGADLNHVLVPKAEPTAAMICEYDGFNTKPTLGLHRQVTLKARAARRIEREARKLPLGHTDGGSLEFSCPADYGALDVVVLSYPGRADVDLAVNDSGCASVANGHILVARQALDLSHWIKPVN